MPFEFFSRNLFAARIFEAGAMSFNTMRWTRSSEMKWRTLHNILKFLINKRWSVLKMIRLKWIKSQITIIWYNYKWCFPWFVESVKTERDYPRGKSRYWNSFIQQFLLMTTIINDSDIFKWLYDTSSVNHKPQHTLLAIVVCF